MESRTSFWHRTKDSVVALGWMLLALAAIDIAIGILFKMPSDPRLEPSKLQLYFDYGRSARSKLRAMVGPDDDHSALIVPAGWIDHYCPRTVITPPDRLGVSIYGNSYSFQIADHLRQIAPKLAITRFGGPAAPPNHSYACFLKQNGNGQQHQAVQVIGITGTSLFRMESIWGVSTTFEFPQPFTFPRYRFDANGHLVAHDPSLRSTDQLRQILVDDRKWNAWLTEVSANDKYFARFLIDEDPFDHSTIGRMVRRAFGQHIVRDRAGTLLSPDNINTTEIAHILPAIMSDFARRARMSGERPIILMFEELGHRGELARILKPTLDKERIEYIDTGNIASGDEPRNFRADLHFAPNIADKIAFALRDLVQKPSPRLSRISPAENCKSAGC